MRCDVAHEALSARLDGEREPVPAARVDDHLASCPQCRAWWSAVSGVPVAGEPVAGTPRGDLLDDVLRTTGSLAGRRRRSHDVLALATTVAGAALVAVGIAQAAGARFGLLGGEDAGGGTHLMNESTAVSVGLGVAVVIASLWRPALAGTAVVLGASTLCLAVYVAHDLVTGDVTIPRVLAHLPLLAATVLTIATWRLRDAPPRPPSASAEPSAAARPHIGSGSSR